MIQHKKQYWDKIGGNYSSEIFDVFGQDKKKRLPRYLNKYADKNVDAIDFGCGTGRGFEYLSPRFRTVLGFDISEKLLDQARALGYPNVTCKKMDLTKWSKEIPSTKFAFCCNVALTSDQEKNYAIIDTVLKSLQKGGAAIFVLPSFESSCLTTWNMLEWYRREETSLAEIPSEDLRHIDFGKEQVSRGVVGIDGAPTKHYSSHEIYAVFNRPGYTINAIDKLEYDWSTEFDSPPAWMRSPLPWDWLVEVQRNK